MKKGISLIVLVITIIVLAILAGAIIISLSNTNIIEQANNAADAADLANVKYAVALEYAAIVAANNDADPSNDVDSDGALAKYQAVIKDTGFTVTVGTELKPVVATN
ncbi:MAG: hypothetical protein IKV94_04175 [Clostridia bacterium]|nr:hypothetical protein [Clostridia bacterium]